LLRTAQQATLVFSLFFIFSPKTGSVRKPRIGLIFVFQPLLVV
jgi:hypothetical protein